MMKIDEELKIEENDKEELKTAGGGNSFQTIHRNKADEQTVHQNKQCIKVRKEKEEEEQNHGLERRIDQPLKGVKDAFEV